MSSKGRKSDEHSKRSHSDDHSSVDRYSNSDLHSKGTFPPNIEGMTSLKVDNITQRTGVNLLKKVFSKFGDLGDVYVPRYPDTFASRGFAFVRFIRKRDAEEAMRKMNGYVLDGRVLSIQMA
ncbi:Serine/arginine rich splicing factor-like protein, partial [Dinothrombium tinctorium]